MDYYYYYSAHKDILNFAEENKIPYQITSSVLTKFGNVVDTLNENSKKYGDSEIRVSKIVSPLKKVLLRKNIEKLTSEGNFFGVYKFGKTNQIDPSKISLPKINSKYVNKLRNSQLEKAYESIKKGNHKENFLDYNHFVSVIGFEDKSLSIKDLDLTKLFQYGVNEELNLKKHDCGKCVISFNSDCNLFSLNASKIGDVIPKDISHEGLRKFFGSNGFAHYAGLHRHIGRNDNEKIIGGGAYFMEGENKIFVDYESQDFGGMNKQVLRKCLESKGLELITLDDQFFDLEGLEEYLSGFIELDEQEQPQEIYSSNDEPDFPDDDVPF